MNDFQKYAHWHTKANDSTVEQWMKHQNSMSLSPYILEERKLNVTQMDVFSRLMMDRIIFLGEGISSDTANVIQAQLLFLDSLDSKAPIHMYINSPGGYVDDGLGIYDTMNFVSAPIYTTCTALAASMGAILLSAGEKGHRSALPHSRIMIHQPMGGAYGQASEMEIQTKEIRRMKTELAEILADNTGKDVKTIMKDFDRDYWMRGDEAVNYGIIDNVLTKKLPNE